MKTQLPVKKPRAPMLPAEIDAAVKAIEACMTFDETKYWADKAEALAAWAKIYHDDLILRKARKLKLHALRQMGSVAGREQPRKGRNPGPKAWLVAKGMTPKQANVARALAMMAPREFDQVDRFSDVSIALKVWAPLGGRLTGTRSVLRSADYSAAVAELVSSPKAKPQLALALCDDLISEITKLKKELQNAIARKLK